MPRTTGKTETERAERADRVMVLSTRMKGAVAVVLRDHLPTDTTLDDILTAYTYTMGELILEFRRGDVAKALEDAAVVADRLPALIRDVLGSVVPRGEH